MPGADRPPERRGEYPCGSVGTRSQGDVTHVLVSGDLDMFDGYAEAKGLPQQFGQQPLVLMNGNDSVHCIRGVIEIGDGEPKLWFTLGPIYTFA